MLPIILRLVSDQESLIDILVSQFSILSICEICKISKLMESNPKKVILLQDGFDEYRARSVITKIISKEEYSRILNITTSRPHSIEQLRRHTSQAVEQHVKLCGFSNTQMIQYINQFCEYHKLPAKTGEDLIKTIYEEREDLLDVGTIPIRTEMICIVWAVYGKLGKTLADLYEMFVIHLIIHWTDKSGTTYIESKREVTEMFKPLLIRVGKLAFHWEKYNQLHIVFSTTELYEVLAGDFENVIKIGLVVKSHPSSILEEAKWSFPHLTIQEYFVAFLLGNSDDIEIVSTFVEKCKNHRVLKRCEMIFTFLCSKYPTVANDILTVLIQHETDETKCNELFVLICRLFQQSSNTTIKIPLPRYLNLESNDIKVDFKILNAFLESDKRQVEPNLMNLSMHEPAIFEKFMNSPNIKQLEVKVYDEEEKNIVCNKLKNLVHLTCLAVTGRGYFPSTGHSDIMESIVSECITELSLIGPGALPAVSCYIQKFPLLQQLLVDDEIRYDDTKHEQKILEVIESNKYMKKVTFGVANVIPPVKQRSADLILNLKLNNIHPDILEKAISDEKFGVGLNELNLNRNNLEHAGGVLGKLMARMSSLKILCMGRCDMKAHTLKSMVDEMSKLNATCGVRTFNIGDVGDHGNNLESGGSYLGLLLNRMPELQKLHIAMCSLTSDDLASMAGALFAPTKIHTLDVRRMKIGDSTGGGVSMLQQMPCLQAIRVGLIKDDDPLPAICKAVDSGALTDLRLLDISGSRLQPGSPKMLGQRLQRLNKLQVISLERLTGKGDMEYDLVFENIPSSVHHLVVYHSSFDLDPYMVLERRHHLGNLLRLNVNMPDRDLDMLQELLEEDIPDLQIYSQKYDRLWEKYADNIIE